MPHVPFGPFQNPANPRVQPERTPPGAADSAPTGGLLERVVARLTGLYRTPSPQAQEPSNSKSEIKINRGEETRSAKLFRCAWFRERTCHGSPVIQSARKSRNGPKGVSNRAHLAHLGRFVYIL